MYIIGVICLLILPFAAGTVCKGILRWKEINQIETYLIGFFFLFLVQGVVFVPCVFLEIPFSAACMAVGGLSAVLLLLGVVMEVFSKRKKQGIPKEDKKKPAYRKGDKLYLVLMHLVFVLLIFKMILGMDNLREDIVLETVATTTATTTATETMFCYHPLTGMLMDGGMIASKKLVTLPLFYASIASLIGIQAEVLLYLVINSMVLVCSYYACGLLFTKITTYSRGKLYRVWTVYGLLLLAGDYHKNTLMYRILYQGYEGTTICFAVLLPYILYIILSWYRQECTEERMTFGMRIQYLLKLGLAAAPAIVISSLGTGLLFLLAAVGIAAVCCLLKSVWEVRACKES